jgi:ABC-type transporter Mla MlaB component
MGDIKYKTNQPLKGEKNVRIYLGGDLSVNNLEDLVDKLKQVEKDFNEFEINISELTSFDLASIQLLISLKKTAERHKKKMKFKIELPKESWELIETTGFTKELKNL